ncbi:MAG: phosphoribosylformylglycinamidine cyclo-ligase [archaeon]
MVTYKDAGVDIDKANLAIEAIKKHVIATRTKSVISDIGSFGGLYKPDLRSISEPVLVSSTDGVGTKLKVAIALNKHDTIGQDLVNHCVNDILVQGARPMYFMDYIAMGKLNHGVIEQVVSGLSVACVQNNCALLGGETAELPGMYSGQDYDIAGFIVGLVDKKDIVDGHLISEGDVVIGLPSSGLHTNGYSLARKIISDAGLDLRKKHNSLGCSPGDALLKPHRSYLSIIERLPEAKIKGMAHITGGGFFDNIPRILPTGLGAVINKGSWPVPAVFSLMARLGNVPETDMYRTFNMGIGLAIVVSHGRAKELLFRLEQIGEKAYEIGKVTSRSGIILC